MSSNISVFMVTHNCISRGEPVVESILQLNKCINDIVVADQWSNDGTDDVLHQLPCKVMFTTLENPYSLFRTQCKNELVLMVDANEVFDYALLNELVEFIKFYDDRKEVLPPKNVSIPRIEVTYNFQKITWNAHEVHRIFPRSSRDWKRIGVTTNKTKLKKMIHFGNEYGFLWAISNNFRDNWYKLAKNKDMAYLPPNHYMSQISMDRQDMDNCKQDELWKCTKTPLHIPDILHNLVGDTKYDPMKNLRRKF